MINNEIWNIISPHAPQIGCEQAEKDAFWHDFHTPLKDGPKDEFIFVGGNLNGHVGQSGEDYEDCHGGKGFGTRNPPGEEILALCKPYELIVLNTMFVAQPRHLVTYSSGGNETQIDYHLVPSFAKRRVKDCKVNRWPHNIVCLLVNFSLTRAYRREDKTIQRRSSDRT